MATFAVGRGVRKQKKTKNERKKVQYNKQSTRRVKNIS